MSLDKNVAPYFDDFDAAKNYFQIIFNPGRAVQARELSQISSSLQNQVTKFANHVFKDGSPIHEATVRTNPNKTVLTLDGVTLFAAGDFLNKTIANGVLGSEETFAVVTGEDVAAQKLFVEIRGGTFVNGDQIRIRDDLTYGYDTDPLNDPYSIGGAYPYQATIHAVDGVVNDALVATVSQGIIYIGGYFAVVPETEIVVDSTGSASSYKVGFIFTETFVDSDADSTLLDPASGSFNFNAPGADRVQGTVSLVSYELADYASIPADYINVVEIVDGEVVFDQSETQYGEILELLAERTYDQAGHYTVNSFGLDVETNDGDATSLDYKIEPGKAIVSGFKVETLGTVVKTVPKAQTFDTISSSINSLYGPYFEIHTSPTATDNSEFDIQGLFDVESKQKIYFFSGQAGTGELLGEGRILAYRRESKHLRIYFRDGSDTGTSKIGSFFSATGSISNNATPGAGTVWANTDRIEGNPWISGLENPNFIFELPTNATKSIGNNNVSYEVNAKFTGIVPSGAGTDEIVLVAPNNYTDFETTNPYGIIAIVDVVTGAVLTADIASVTPSNSDGVASTLTIQMGSLLPNNVDVAIRMERHAQDGNAKTKAVASTTESAVFTYNNALGNDVPLVNHDIIRILSITSNPGGVPVDLDVALPSLDNGARDYILMPGEVTISAGNAEFADGIDYDIEYEYFAHSGNGDYFNVNSYPDYDAIPAYTTSDGRKTVELRDCFDFRRTLADIEGAGVLSVHPGVTITISGYDRYLPRYDAITVDENGAFEVMQGNPEANPKKPNTSSKTMTLYSVLVNAYTFADDDMEINRIENKNYTMNEIGLLEKRLESLEYYNSLNLLEREAKDLSITDANGLEKFKNGILVDTFTGHGIGDMDHPDYDINIDAEYQIARTPTNIDYKDLAEAGGSSGVTEHPNITTLSYSTTSAIDQPLASESMNVNPYAVFLWNGIINMVPPSDNWVDTTRLPATVANFQGNAQAWRALSSAANRSAGFGNQWGSWRNVWQGSRTVGRFSTSRTAGGWAWDGNSNQSWGRTTTTRNFDIRQNTTVSRRTGIRTEVVPETIRRSIGDRVVNSSVVPWIRAKNVTFTADGMKPYAEVTATFDGVDVTALITWDAGYIGTGIKGKSNAGGRVKGTFAIPGATFRTGSRAFRLEDDTVNPSTSAEATYTAQGLMNTVQGTIVSTEVPGIRRTSISQSSVSSSRSVVQTGFSVATTPTRWSDPLAQSFLVDQDGGMFVSDIEIFFKLKDPSLPVTVSIVTNENGYPSQNEVPFAKKTLFPDDLNTIKAVVNSAFGVQPTHANSTDNSDGLLPTVFTFDNPVKLEQGVEYSFVIMSNSDNYEAYVAEIGANDLAGNLIAKQPYTGVMFKSQNSSTWTADQTRDIKFKISRCVFGASGVYDLEAVSAGSTEDVTAMNLNIDTGTFPDTALDWSYQFVEDGALEATVTKADIEFNGLKTIPVATPLSIVANLASTKDNLSPVVNNNRMSVILLENDIGTVIDANSRYEAGTYITKTIKMENVSDDVKVLLDAIKPGNSEIEVYYKLGESVPRYVEIEDLSGDSDFHDEFATDVEKVMRDLDKGQTASVYQYEDTGNGTILKQVGTSIITDITSDGVGTRRLYMKDISDVTLYVDAADAGHTFEKVIISTDNAIEDDAPTQFEYSAGQAYVVGETIIYLDRIYRCVTAGTGNTPTEFSTAWDEVPTYFMQTGLGVGANHAVREDASIEWLPMVADVGALDTENAENQVIEYTYIPEKEIDEGFTSIAIKVTLKTIDKINIPTFGAFRAIASF